MEKAMYIAKLTTIVSFATVLGAASPVLADTPSGSLDGTGMLTIGIDVSRIGTSSEAVQQYLASVGPETLRGVIGGCQTVAANAQNYHANVQAFCANVNGGASTDTALGFAPVDRSVRSPAAGAMAPAAAY